MLGMTRPTLVVAGLLAITLVTVAGSAVPTPAGAAPTASIVHTGLAPDSLTATIRYVREHGIDVITGVQLALKLTYIVVDTSTAIRKDGESVAVTALKPGDLVTIHYRETERGKVAQRIEVHPLVGREGEP
jgi:hypothetical protein